MSRRPNPWLIGLALLALGWAQVFGLMRGYLCDCSGVAQISSFDHCHGHEGEACHHDGEASTHPCQDPHEDDEQVPCETHDHEPVKENVQAQMAASGSSIVPAAPPLLFVLTDFELRRFIVCPTLFTPRKAPDWVSAYREWPRVLTHSVALRI